jgi:hypothetical protein
MGRSGRKRHGEPAEAVLKLYHFTSLWNLGNVGPGNIRAAGLKPFPNDYDDLLVKPSPPLVWLTTDGEAWQDGQSLASFMEARLTVELPASDSRLKHWWTYFCDRVTPEDRAFIVSPTHPDRALFEYAERHWYVYFGTVRPQRITAMEKLAETAMSPDDEPER